MFRYERKFIINNLTIPELENILRNSNLKFKKNYKKRKINSIYFDKANFSSFFENIDGNNLKKKIRLRWYGDKKIILSPNLEVKKKNAHLNQKLIYKIKNFKKITPSFRNILYLLKKLKKKYFFLSDTHPISSTHYDRLYFVSSQKNIRATIDYNINYINFVENQNLNKFSKSVILEIKYSNNSDNTIRKCLSNISFRINKNSKYINSLIEQPFFVI